MKTLAKVTNRELFLRTAPRVAGAAAAGPLAAASFSLEAALSEPAPDPAAPCCDFSSDIHFLLNKLTLLKSYFAAGADAGLAAAFPAPTVLRRPRRVLAFVFVRCPR